MRFSHTKDVVVWRWGAGAEGVSRTETLENMSTPGVKLKTDPTTSGPQGGHTRLGAHGLEL